MTYLIALVIAIALGAVIALLSFVNIGSGFSGQSATAKAQQFAQAGSQLEVAMSAYRAAESGSAFTTDLAGTVGALGEWIKESPISPIDGSALVLTQPTLGGSVYLSVTGTPTGTTGVLSNDICLEIQELAGSTIDITGASDLATAITAVGSGRLACGLVGTNNIAIFRVE